MRRAGPLDEHDRRLTDDPPARRVRVVQPHGEREPHHPLLEKRHGRECILSSRVTTAGNASGGSAESIAIDDTR